MGYLPKRIYIAIALAVLNLTIGGLVAAFKLPIYLDSLGIVLATILLGWRLGVLTALITVGIGFLTINPYLPFYVMTSLVIVMTVAVLYRTKMFDSLFRTIVSGLIIAGLSALASAPITTYLGGNTLSGADAITSFLLASGRSLWGSVLITGLTAEPVDKVLVSVLAYLTIRRLPHRLLDTAGLRGIPRST